MPHVTVTVTVIGYHDDVDQQTLQVCLLQPFTHSTPELSLSCSLQLLLLLSIDAYQTLHNKTSGSPTTEAAG
jgi:hypothetical protein